MKRLDKLTFDFSEYSIKETKILPLFTLPYHDELFSSWVLRSCYKYQLKPHTFTKFLWHRTSIWTRDIDKSLKQESLEEFCKVNRTPFDVGFKTTLKSFEGKLFAKVNENGTSDFINTAGVYHRRRKQFALMYCPICLGKNKYYKLIWRLSLECCCTICKIYLNDRCPHCKEAIVPFRLNIDKKLHFYNTDLNICWNCKKQLSDCEIRKASMKILKFTNEFERHIYCCDDISRLFFRRLLFLKRILVSNRKIISYLREKGICNIYSVDKPKKNKDFERLDIFKRIEIIKGIIYFLSDWPKNFYKFTKGSKLKYSEIVCEKSHKELYPKELLQFLFPKN